MILSSSWRQLHSYEHYFDVRWRVLRELWEPAVLDRQRQPSMGGVLIYASGSLMARPRQSARLLLNSPRDAWCGYPAISALNARGRKALELYVHRSWQVDAPLRHAFVVRFGMLNSEGVHAGRPSIHTLSDSSAT
jgi:hypothetical protein